MPRANRNDFPDLSGEAKAMEKLFKALPTIAGNMALNFYNDSWRREGFVGDRFKKWARRARPDADTRSRRLLVKSGNLRRSLRMKVSGNQVTIYTDIPYAQIHNEGGKVSGTANIKAHTRRTGGKRVQVRAHSRQVNFTVPQRQFMDVPGSEISPFLRRRIVENVKKAMDKIMRNA